MRWSLFSLVSLLTVLIADVTALPMPQCGSSDLVLERRATTRSTSAKLGSSKPATRPSAAKKASSNPATKKASSKPAAKKAPSKPAAKKAPSKPAAKKASLKPAARKVKLKAASSAAKKAQGSLKASTFKKASSTYRNAALKSKNPMYSVKSGRITKSAPPKKMPKGHDADHIFEAQTMKHAAQKAGHTKTSLAPAMKDIKDRINHPSNMAFLDPKTNKDKGKAHTAVQSGKTPAKDRNVADYLKHTSAAGKATAVQVDKILKSHGITDINVSKEHNKVLKAHGVKRREYSDEDLD